MIGSPNALMDIENINEVSFKKYKKNLQNRFLPTVLVDKVCYLLILPSACVNVKQVTVYARRPTTVCLEAVFMFNASYVFLGT